MTVEIKVSAKPHLLLETIELLYAYVNRIPVEELATRGEYSPPQEAVQKIMDVACADISRDDPAMQYYFGRYTPPEENWSTCMARSLACNGLEISRGTVAEDCQFLREDNREHMKVNWRITGLRQYGLSFLESDNSSFISAAEDIAKLQLAPEYTQKLLEQFSDYDHSIACLEELVTPVAEKLTVLLEPWVERTWELARAWQNYLEQPGAGERFLQRCGCRDNVVLERIHMQLRYFLPVEGFGMRSLDNTYCCVHMAVSTPLEGLQQASIRPWEVEALRLLGNTNRLRILQTLLDTPMSAREVAQELQMNLGGVCRDINNLYEVGLLYIESDKHRRRYRTNGERLQLLAHHIAALNQFKLE